MNRLIEWMTKTVQPKLNKVAHNPWIGSVQDGYMKSMGLILIGSFSMLFISFQAYLPSWFPDLTNLYYFSLGLLGLHLAYLIPSAVMEKKKHRKLAKQTGLIGLSVFLILINPVFSEDGVNFTVEFTRMGGMGSLVSIVGGLLVAAVMNFSANHPMFKEDSAMPDFIQAWFETLIPGFVCIFAAYTLTFGLKFDVYNAINWLFQPLVNAGQSFWGFVIMYGLGFTFIYSFGISPWVIGGISNTICYTASAQNYALVAAGQAPVWINTNEVMLWCLIGGSGATLSLSLMMLFAKSKKLKSIGKTCILPSICNINEPLVYGVPIAMNPILMIPFIASGFIIPALVYLAFSLGFVPIPKYPSPFGLFAPFDSFYMSGFMGLILCIIVIVVSGLIFYPFFKMYDKQVLEEEQAQIK